jgi:hypothetical protein
MGNGTPPCKAALNLSQTIIPPNHHNVNSGNLNSYTKPPFLGILQTILAAKPPYKT